MNIIRIVSGSFAAVNKEGHVVAVVEQRHGYDDWIFSPLVEPLSSAMNYIPLHHALRLAVKFTPTEQP